MTVLALGEIHLRGWFGSSAGCRYAKQRLRGRRRKNDDALLTPGASAAADDVAYVLGRASIGVDLLQLACGEEADLPAVGRPERIHRIVGSRQSLRHQRDQRANIQQNLAFVIASRKRELRSVG